jgi:hypothetical protein
VTPPLAFGGGVVGMDISKKIGANRAVSRSFLYFIIFQNCKSLICRLLGILSSCKCLKISHLSVL